MSRLATALAAFRAIDPDRRAETALGAVAALVLVTVLGMLLYVFKEAYASFESNGLSWFGSPGKEGVDSQLSDIFNSSAEASTYKIGTWPLIVGTVLTTAGAVAAGLVVSILTAIFIVEFAPDSVRRILEPAVRLLAAVPSVIYGLLGLLILVPFVVNTLVTDGAKESVAYVVQLTGASLLVATIVLALMITPIMTAIITDALRSVPGSWREGSIALGVNSWRTIAAITVRAARPAIIAAAVLATGRAIGEAIMLSMVSGSTGFAPNPLDGWLFFLEPVRPLAATIVENSEGLSVKPFGETLYAMAAVLLVSTMLLSLGAYAAKLPLRKYSGRG